MKLTIILLALTLALVGCTTAPEQNETENLTPPLNEAPVADEGIPTPDDLIPVPEEDETDESELRMHTVQITTSGFEPQSITISEGDTVTWVNSAGRSAWPASDVHPTHSLYDGTALSAHCPGTASFDACTRLAEGESYSFTFDKPGTWTYHDHLSAGATGTVIVQ